MSEVQQVLMFAQAANMSNTASMDSLLCDHEAASTLSAA
jgi:hypothetical protein